MQLAVCLACALGLLGWVTPPGQVKPRTLREMLREHGVTDVRSFPQDLLDAPIHDEKRGGRYVRVSFHMSPSAERLLVLSPDMKLVRELFGWELALLPDDRLVFRHSQGYGAATFTLQMSVFDPATSTEQQIYPPRPYQPVRAQFIERVARAYKERGAAWFRENNHHMDPERFDSALMGPVSVDAARRSLSFRVRFGDPQNARDGLSFSQMVEVTCGPIDAARIQCQERAEASPGR